MLSVCAKTCSNHDTAHMNITITFVFTLTATRLLQSNIASLLLFPPEFDHDAPSLYQHLTLS